MRLGKMAKLAGVNIQTIRYYERRGILKPVSRTESGYRLYEDKELKRLKFIRCAKGWGFTLKEIKELMDIRITSPSACNKAMKQVEEKMKTVEQKIESLQSARRVLKELITACKRRTPTEECPILKAIDKGGK
ncbi:MAG: heavy metal-responsive transcriptional regulator [Nitrospirae bacterium]|nr:heavy metal-responsive transcriptional regulator [Nitrospirota bacterium]